MPHLKQASLLALVPVLFSIPATADLFYDSEKEAQIANLRPVDSARQTFEYNCGKFSLFVTAYANVDESNGRRASVSGKIVSPKQTHDISEDLSRAITNEDLIYKGMTVRCNKTHGAFTLLFSSGQQSGDEHQTRVQSTRLKIYADGFIMGSRILSRHKTSN